MGRARCQKRRAFLSHVNQRTLSHPMRGTPLFVARFTVILLVSFFIMTSGPFDRHFVTPVTALLAQVSGVVLRGLGEHPIITGTSIESQRFSVNILNGCNGMEAILVIVASMFAYPGSMVSRLIGVLTGSVALELLNLVRIVSLFLLGSYHRAIFDLFHSAVWQVLIILASLGIFLLWIDLVSAKRQATPDPPSRGAADGTS